MALLSSTQLNFVILKASRSRCLFTKRAFKRALQSVLKELAVKETLNSDTVCAALGMIFFSMCLSYCFMNAPKLPCTKADKFHNLCIGFAT